MLTRLDVATNREDASTDGRQPILLVRDLVAVRQGRVVLDVKSLEISKGEVLAVIGPNGAGKSSLLLSMVLLIPLTSGEIHFAGERVHPNGDAVRLRRKTATVFQEPLLLDTSVRDNVAIGLQLRGIGRTEAARRVDWWMHRFGIDHLSRRRARQISGGEAQRVALARAFATEPELLLLDEPFSALDAPTRTRLLDDFEEVLRESQTTALFVTHDRSEAMRVGDRIAVIIDGGLSQVGSSEEVFSRPANQDVAAFVGMENLADGTILVRRGSLAMVRVGSSIIKAHGDHEAGRAVTVGLRPEDVELKRLDAADASGEDNHVRGKVRRVVPVGGQIRVEIGGGFPLTVLATPRSVHDMGLRAGMEVDASFKAGSVHLMSISSGLHPRRLQSISTADSAGDP